MLGFNFYHSLTRKYVILFGNCFNDIVIRRVDKNQRKVAAIQVPISYSPKRKWVTMLHDDVSRSVAVQLPRLGFAIVGMTYDRERKLSIRNKIAQVADTKDTLYTGFHPVPYKLQFELYAIAKNYDDVAQIHEQIIPFFVSDFTQSVEIVPELGRNWDISLRLQSVSPQDVYEQQLPEQQGLFWTWTFEMDCWYFGPIQKQGVIKRVQIDLHAVPGTGEITDEEVANTARSSRISVTPGLTANGEPTTSKDESIDWQNIDADDDYGFVTEVEFFTDGRKYDPVTGTDQPIENDDDDTEET